MRMLPSREKTRRRVGHPPCSTNYRFTGYERDAETSSVTGSMYYAFARYYNSREGRFMSGDPLAGDISDPQTLNRYSYVRNNPVNLTDPSGALPTFDELDWYLPSEDRDWQIPEKLSPV